MKNRDLLEIERIAQAAGKLLLSMSHSFGRATLKEDGTGLVTAADNAAEELIISELERSFPGTSFLAEESGLREGDAAQGQELHPRAKGSRWIIDPLDGTNNYAHHFPWYCVSIGLETDGEVEAGVIYQPVLQETVSAWKGQGATLNGEAIFVSEIRSVDQALLTVGFYYHRHEILEQEIARFGQVHKKALGIRRPGSAALDLAYVAAGRLDGFWEKGLNPWDMAAGVCIAREAGALISRYDGSEFSLYGKELLVTNPYIHSELLQLLRLV